MALPAGIVTTQITFGTAVTMISAKNLTMSVTFTPTTSLVWAATGTVLIADAEGFNADPGTQGSVTLINPDQAGFSDGNGNTIRNFGYKVEATYADGKTVLFTAPAKYITWTAADAGPLDLDQMIPVAASSGITVSMPLATIGEVAAGYLPKPVNTIVYDGDSITQIGGGIPANPFFNGRGFWCWGQTLTSHRLRNLGNVAVAGQTTAGILARINATLALTPGWVHILAGTNDIGQNVAAATTQANLAAYYDACDAAGLRILAGTIPPNDGWTTAQKQSQAATNLWIRNLARTRRNFVVIDYAAAITDPATGGWVSGYAQTDGTHPSIPGAQAMGRLLAQSILSLNPPAPMLLSDPLDSSNLLTPVVPGAGRFAAGAWTQGGTTATLSKVARTDGIAGSWQRVVVPTGGDSYMQSPNVDSTGLHGQQFVATVEYALTSLDPAPAAHTQAFYLTLQSYNGSGFNASIADLYWDTTYENQGSGARSGVLRTPPFTVPNDSVVLQAVLHLTGGGTYDLDRASITAA